MSTSVYRAEPIGSLLRPAWLVDARKALRRGELSAAGYKKIEDRAAAAQCCQLLADAGGPFRRRGGADYAGAIPGEALGDGRANTARSAGHQGNFSIQHVHPR